MLQVRLCLVINKMDRLILELGLSPQEAYTRLKGIITHVNMIVSAFRSEQHISEADAVLAHQDAMATLDERWHPSIAAHHLGAFIRAPLHRCTSFGSSHQGSPSVEK